MWARNDQASWWSSQTRPIALLGGVGHLDDGVAGEVGHLHALQVRPEVLDGVQCGRIGRQPLHLQPCRWVASWRDRPAPPPRGPLPVAAMPQDRRLALGDQVRRVTASSELLDSSTTASQADVTCAPVCSWATPRLPSARSPPPHALSPGVRATTGSSPAAPPAAARSTPGPGAPRGPAGDLGHPIHGPQVAGEPIRLGAVPQHLLDLGDLGIRQRGRPPAGPAATQRCHPALGQPGPASAARARARPPPPRPPPAASPPPPGGNHDRAWTCPHAPSHKHASTNQPMKTSNRASARTFVCGPDCASGLVFWRRLGRCARAPPRRRLRWWHRTRVPARVERPWP